jgi:hypothetical protein
LEGLAEWAYRAACLPDDVPAGGLELAQRLLHCDVPLIRCLGGNAARLTRTAKGWVLAVQRGGSVTQTRWLIAHELAEWLLERDGYREEDVEAVADALAARLIAPRRAVRQALRYGMAVPDLAEAFGATQSCVLLRQAEVAGAPTALITPMRVYVRGDVWAWPSESEVRRLVAEPRPGLAKVRLTDARRRVGLVAT